MWYDLYLCNYQSLLALIELKNVSLGKSNSGEYFLFCFSLIYLYLMYYRII